MTPTAQLATDILVAATVVMDVVIVLLVFGTLLFRGKIEAVLERSGLCGRCLALLASVCAFFGSILYQTITGFAACPLCWTQRIAMALVAVALVVDRFLAKGKSIGLLWSARMVALIGLVVGSYQYVLQWLAMNGTHLPCPAIEGLPSCDRVYFVSLGFITIPFVAITSFALILLLLSLRDKEVSTIAQ